MTARFRTFASTAGRAVSPRSQVRLSVSFRPTRSSGSLPEPLFLPLSVGHIFTEIVLQQADLPFVLRNPNNRWLETGPFYWHV